MRRAGLLAPVAAIGCVVMGGAAAGSVPHAWLAYATALSRQMQARLALRDDPVVDGLHAFLDARMALDPHAAPPRIVVRVWVDGAGRIDRVAFASLGRATADADLRAALIGVSAGRAPPAGMSQPVVLRLSLALPS